MIAYGRHVLVAIALATNGCSELTIDSTVAQARGDLLGVTRDAVEHALVGTLDVASGASVSSDDAIYTLDAQRPAGIAARVAVLEALALPDRKARVEALDAARKESSDPLFRTYIDHLLEQDDEWFARALERDEIWTVTAGFFNGVLATAYAALNGNPIGVVKPLVNGVDGLIRDVPLDARDRRLAALKKRMAQKGEVDDDTSYNLAKEIAELEESTVKEELWLARKALDRDRADVAAMHWWVAKTVRPTDEEVFAVAGEIEARVKARGQRLDLALRVEPIERNAGFDERDGWALQPVAILIGARIGEHDGRLRPPPRMDLIEIVASAEDRHSSERSRFVWTGRRASHDPLKRYSEARAALHQSFLDRLEPLFWVPATLFRGAINLFTDPVNDQPLVDTLARTARNVPQDDPRRVAVLQKLAERLEDRGNAEQAFAVAKAASLDAATLAKYERKATEAETRRAEERARREAALAAHGATIPAYALAPYATRYGFSRDLVDGRRDNGEVAPRGVLLEGSKLVLDIERDGEIERFEVSLDATETLRMDALAREWGWRRRAAAVETYERLHGGWPVEMYAGVGASGVAAYPRLLPEEISADERKLWE